jgi:Uma2 family endonuclease
MSKITRLVTAEELERMPDDPVNRFELVEGRLVRMSPVSFDHGRIVVRLLVLLQRYLDDAPVGVVVADVGFKLASNPDTVRGPDIAFLRSDRLPSRGTRGFLKEPPDAVFEVLSPGDRPSEIRRKTAEYLEKGVPIVVVIDPEESTITMSRPAAPSITLRSGNDLLDLSEVIPGFRCHLREIFE